MAVAVVMAACLTICFNFYVGLKELTQFTQIVFSQIPNLCQLSGDDAVVYEVTYFKIHAIWNSVKYSRYCMTTKWQFQQRILKTIYDYYGNFTFLGA